MKKTAEEMLDELHLMLDGISNKIENKQVINITNEKKNSHLHLLIETSLMNKIQKEADGKCISVSELVRQRLREKNQLDRIENKLDIILKRK